MTTLLSCSMQSVDKESNSPEPKKEMTAKEILGSSDYLAISYGGYRNADHDIEPTIDELKEDLKLLSAMGIRIMRTYKVHFPHAANLLKAIRQLKLEDPQFEMYVMLGAWIDCKHAWTDQEPDHYQESERNEVEIATAVELANQYPDIVKILAVGNEAMVKWAAAYYVQPNVILRWVNHLQDLKIAGKLSKDLWITSSDNFASWGGGDSEYHVEDLTELINAVDYVSLHTYPMHDTHYNPMFWGILESEKGLSKEEKISAAMTRSMAYAKSQYNNTVAYIQSLGIEKPVHIGETGWATVSGGLYGPKGSKATDEYKSAVYYKLMRDWTKKEKIACFYFEAFDEPWKGGADAKDSEKHFGLFTVEGKAKNAIWDLVDQGLFKNLKRGGNQITKTFDGQINKLLEMIDEPPLKKDSVSQ